ncbi:hypothetical protein Tco_1192981 [Tanacetum coccineum]
MNSKLCRVMFEVATKFDTFKLFSNPFFELDEEIITLEKDVFQNEVISNQEKINDTCETERDLKFFDDLLNEDPLPPDVFNVENDFQDNKEEIDISCDMIPPGIDTDETRRGQVMFNDSHTYGENISQVEREFLSMVDEFLNLSNDDETFDPGGGENDVLLNNGENNDLNFVAIAHHREPRPRGDDCKPKGLWILGFVRKGVVAITPQMLAAEWGFDSRTPVAVLGSDIILGERPK